MTEEMKKEETVNETAETAEDTVKQDETVQEPEAEPNTETTAEDETKEETEASNEAEAPKEKKKLFSKKKDKKDEKIEELTDQLRRQMAEFDNYRKRTDKEKASMYIIGAKEIVEKLLPVVDSFERGLATATEEQLEDPFVDGMNKVYKQMITSLEELGVKPIEAVGAEFNPDYHNPVMHVEDEEVGENIIVEEFQKGYTYKDFVVRHSMVKVAN